MMTFSKSSRIYSKTKLALYFLSAKIMFRLLLILFVITLYARTDIFKRIKKKHGQSVLNVVRKLENYKTKIIKLQDINFTKMCKRENLIPTFANIKLAIKTGNTKEENCSLDLGNGVTKKDTGVSKGSRA